MACISDLLGSATLVGKDILPSMLSSFSKTIYNNLLDVIKSNNDTVIDSIAAYMINNKLASGDIDTVKKQLKANKLPNQLAAVAASIENSLNQNNEVILIRGDIGRDLNRKYNTIVFDENLSSSAVNYKNKFKDAKVYVKTGNNVFKEVNEDGNLSENPVNNIRVAKYITTETNTTYENILRMSNEINYNPIEHKYTVGNKELTNVTSTLSEKRLFDVDLFPNDDAAFYGTMVDAIVRSIVRYGFVGDTLTFDFNGKTYRVGDYISPYKLDELQQQVKLVLSQFDNIELVGDEVRVYHKTDNYAGTTDIIGVLPNGNIVIIDTKTFINDDGFYKKLNDKYKKQLSMYADAFESHGIKVEGVYVLGVGIDYGKSFRNIKSINLYTLTRESTNVVVDDNMITNVDKVEYNGKMVNVYTAYKGGRKVKVVSEEELSPNEVLSDVSDHIVLPHYISNENAAQAYYANNKSKTVNVESFVSIYPEITNRERLAEILQKYFNKIDENTTYKISSGNTAYIFKGSKFIGVVSRINGESIFSPHISTEYKQDKITIDDIPISNGIFTPTEDDYQRFNEKLNRLLNEYGYIPVHQLAYNDLLKYMEGKVRPLRVLNIDVKKDLNEEQLNDSLLFDVANYSGTNLFNSYVKVVKDKSENTYIIYNDKYYNITNLDTFNTFSKSDVSSDVISEMMVVGYLPLVNGDVILGTHTYLKYKDDKLILEYDNVADKLEKVKKENYSAIADAYKDYLKDKYSLSDDQLNRLLKIYTSTDRYIEFRQGDRVLRISKPISFAEFLNYLHNNGIIDSIAPIDTPQYHDSVKIGETTIELWNVYETESKDENNKYYYVTDIKVNGTKYDIHTVNVVTGNREIFSIEKEPKFGMYYISGRSSLYTVENNVFVYKNTGKGRELTRVLAGNIRKITNTIIDTADKDVKVGTEIMYDGVPHIITKIISNDEYEAYNLETMQTVNISAENTINISGSHSLFVYENPKNINGKEIVGTYIQLKKNTYLRIHNGKYSIVFLDELTSPDVANIVKESLDIKPESSGHTLLINNLSLAVVDEASNIQPRELIKNEKGETLIVTKVEKDGEVIAYNLETGKVDKLKNPGRLYVKFVNDMFKFGNNYFSIDNDNNVTTISTNNIAINGEVKNPEVMEYTVVHTRNLTADQIKSMLIDYKDYAEAYVGSISDFKDALKEHESNNIVIFVNNEVVLGKLVDNEDIKKQIKECKKTIKIFLTK